MATADYILDNATGANFRSDLNSTLAAIVSNNSSSTEPSTKYAYQWWADTNEGVLKIRNSANDGWVTLLQLDGTLTLEDGSNSAPALGFRDDLNTGIFSSAADTLDVTCGGTTRGSFSSSGLAVTGNVTATTFVGNVDAVDGDFDGTLEADAITVAGTALATVIAGTTVTTATNANHVSVADNESTNENNLIPFIEDASATGNVGLESDGDFTYNPSTGTVTATVFVGAFTGNVTGNASGTAATVTGAAQSNITSLGTLTGLTLSGDVTFTGASANVVFDKSDNALEFADNAKAIFGSSDELQIYYDGSNPIFYAGTNTVRVVADNIHFEAGDFGDEFLRCNHDSSVDLYFDNDAKLVTTGSGVTVTGTVSDTKGDVRKIIINNQSSAYTLVASDMGKAVNISSGGVTVPNAVFSAGDAITIINNSGSNQTITQGTNVTMYNTADGSTGNRTLAARGMATMYFTGSSTTHISGSGLS